MAPNLEETAAKLATQGPTKQEPTKRRVRGLLNGQFIFDTLDSVYVWEHQYYPYFYVPLADLEAGPAKVTKGNLDPRGFWLGNLEVGGSKSIEIASFETAALAGLVKIPVASLDAWFAEDERLLGGHPKDPYKRIECLPSSRLVEIKVGGVAVAKSSNNIFLHETSLRRRHYLSPTSILDWAMLRPSDTVTFCPYKGEAQYYHLVLPGGQEIKDVVWYYTYPTHESAAIQGRVCFYDEKVEVFVDGVQQK